MKRTTGAAWCCHRLHKAKREVNVRWEHKTESYIVGEISGIGTSYQCFLALRLV